MIKKLFILIFLIVVSLNSFSQKAIGDFNMNWPPNKMFIRIFKYERELEVWVSDSVEFRLYKKYNICMLSGGFGPKRKQGDLQVPEGFYYINHFNPFSKYHLSLGINYPNQSDRILSPYKNLGGLIYIHGECVSIGCVAVRNEIIDEIYSLAKRISGKIQVHIFPINYRYLKSLRYLDDSISLKPELLEFEKNLFEGYMYFQENERLPEITFLENGFCNFK